MWRSSVTQQNLTITHTLLLEQELNPSCKNEVLSNHDFCWPYWSQLTFACSSEWLSFHFLVIIVHKFFPEVCIRSNKGKAPLTGLKKSLVQPSPQTQGSHKTYPPKGALTLSSRGGIPGTKGFLRDFWASLPSIVSSSAPVLRWLWPPHVKSWLIGKDPDAGRDWGQEEKGTTEDEMAGWHHRLDGHEFE